MFLLWPASSPVMFRAHWWREHLIKFHVIKIITWNLADVWHITFPSDPSGILFCVGIGIIDYNIKIRLNFSIQLVHQFNIIKYGILLKTEYEWVTRHKYGLHDDSFQVWKKSLPTKILSSFALTAQPHQNINHSYKRAYS